MLLHVGQVRRDDPNILLFNAISMKAHIHYDRHWTCPIDGEVDAETCEKDVNVFSPNTATGQPGRLYVEDGSLILGQTPIMGNDLEKMGLPMPRFTNPADKSEIFKWNMHLMVPYKTVRRSRSQWENDQWLVVRIYSDINQKGPSLGQQGFEFQSNPEAKVSLLTWNVKSGRGGVSEIPPDGHDTSTNAKWSADVSWKFGASDRRVRITYPEENQNYIFGSSSEPGKLEMLPEATTGNPVDDLTMEPWSIDPIAGSELKIVTSPGNSSPARGPNVKINFDKMPSRNDAFGRKTIKCEDASVTVKVFFDKKKKDNPEGSAPNWFYYWKQGPVPQLEGFRYLNRNDIYGKYSKVLDRLYICNPAAEPEPAYQIQLYQTIRGAGVARPKGPKHYAKRGMIRPWQVINFPAKTGIETCHATVLHEIRHKEVYGMLKGHPPEYDLDGDGLPNWVEEASEWNMDPLNPDTHFVKNQVDTGYASYGDDELLARIRELDHHPDKNQDWAWPGSQSDPPEK